jgi:7-keto-8-aminopelargonate synthetase-like enzyme
MESSKHSWVLPITSSWTVCRTPVFRKVPTQLRVMCICMVTWIFNRPDIICSGFELKIPGTASLSLRRACSHLAALQEICHEFDATLLVDVAHDLGAIGGDGRGFIGMQNMLGKIDIVMGSFSKTFASNGGFVSCNSPAVKQYLKFYGCSATFSNALSPVQAATVTKAFEIVQSEKGHELRWLLMKRVHQLRKALQNAGLGILGDPSPIVPVVIGDEALARRVSRRLPELGVVANLVEYPAVAKGNARFRFQVMPTHTSRHVHDLAKRFRSAVDAAQSEYGQYREQTHHMTI